MKKVKILMATFNGEKYLEEQLESLFNQKNVQISILVRDDCSTDNTQKILEKYQQKGKLKWYCGEKLKAAFGFMDLIYKTDEADYYAFCDQDDVWDDDKLEIAIKKLEKFDVDIPALYYCGQRLVDENLNFISNHELNIKRSNQSCFVFNNMAGCTAVFNKKLLEKVREKEPKYIIMHDNWIYKVCASLGGNIYMDKDVHMSYRQHGNNVIGLKSNLFGKIKRAKKIIFKYELKRMIEELFELYGNQMTDEYIELCKMIINYKKSIKNWFSLFNNKNINFKDKGLNLTFKLKMIFFKL